MLGICQIQEASFQVFSVRPKKDFEYYQPLNFHILTPEREITHWEMDFLSGKMNLLELR